MKRKSKFTWSNFKLIFNKNRERLSSSTILVKGNLVTCIILSLASGIIDLAFFSGLSKSSLHVGTILMSAAILYTVISVGLISAKFWCAMKLGMVKELETKLTAKNFSWAKNLRKAQIPWHIAHKFLIVISIVTALSLSVNSSGSALKYEERNVTNITIVIEKFQTLENQRKSDNSDKRSLTRGNLEGIATASTKAQESTNMYWPIFEQWQNKLSGYKAELENEIDEEKILEIENKIKKERQSAYDRAPRGIGVTLASMDDMSPILLKNLFTKAAKQSEIDSDSIKAYEALSNEIDEEIRNTILAYENVFKHPNEYKDGVMIEGKPVSFLDENGEPMDITQVIGILQGLREEWKANTDIGESSQIFILVSELVGGSGIAETLMIIFIAIVGIVQEFLIYLFTPKAAIDRKLLRQVSHYLQWSSIEEKERFLIEVYIEYKGDGVINQEQFDFECKKCVDDMNESVDSVVAKYSPKAKLLEAKPRQPRIIKNDEVVNIEPKEVKEEKGYGSAVEAALAAAEEI